MFQTPQQNRFDWARAIEINRDALIAIVAAIFGMLRIEADDEPERLPRHLHRAAFRLLRSAESAARRLIVMATRGLVMPSPPSPPSPPALRPKAQGSVARKARMQDTPGRQRVPAFQLHDPRKSFKPRRQRRKPSVLPTISIMGYDAHVLGFSAAPPAPAAFPPEPEPDDGQTNARPLCRRLQALKAALDDVPKQARRLMRWQARRQQIQKLRPVFATPLRPGLPPGWRRKPVHEVDQILRECESLAAYAMAPDTS
jgi:hypothetical protein